jgi:hypothetical protein
VETIKRQLRRRGWRLIVSTENQGMQQSRQEPAFTLASRRLVKKNADQPKTVGVRPRRRRRAMTFRPDLVLLRWRKPLTRFFFNLELRMLIFIAVLFRENKRRRARRLKKAENGIMQQNRLLSRHCIKSVRARGCKRPCFERHYARHSND